MNLSKIIFALLIGFLLIIAAIWMIPEPPGSTGILHPDFKTMLHGGVTMKGNIALQVLSFLFGFALLSLIFALIFLGARKGGQPTGARRWIWLGYGLTIFNYLMIFTSYLKSLHGDTSFLLAFPTASAWMLYGLFISPAIVVIIYVWRFNDWVLTEEDMERFRELVEENKKKEH